MSNYKIKTKNRIRKKRKSINKVCKRCNKKFIAYKEITQMCSKCSDIGLNRCINCNKFISRRSTRCKSCNMLYRMKINPPIKSNNGIYGKKHKSSTKEKMRKKAIGRNAGHKSRFWKGGRINHHGYIYLYLPEHPFAKRKYYQEHRYKMEQKIGRFLLPEEIVHHKNRIKDDNRIRNLQLFESNSAHATHHQKLNRRKRS